MKTPFIVSLCLAFTCINAIAAEGGAVAPTDTVKCQFSSKEKVQRYRMRRFGGFLRDTRNQRGRVVIINCQSAVSEKVLEVEAETVANDISIRVEVEKGAFTLTKPEIKGEANVFIVDDPTLPMSLVAPESRWSMVNVSFYKNAKPAFVESRVMKAITRAVVPLLGGSDSQYPLCVMGNVLKPEDLDRFPNSRLPVDVIERFRRNMPGLGITAWEMSTYRAACEEGWATQPTNEFQKSIWDAVHNPPSKPLKISYDPAAQKPVVK